MNVYIEKKWIDRRPLLPLMSCKMAYEMWMKIKTIFERDNEQKCSLLQSFYSLTFDKENEMVTYISNLRNIANILNRMDVVISDSMIISKVSATLPEEYGYFASAWDSTVRNNKTLENLTSRLIAE